LPKAAIAAVIPDSSLCNRSSSFFSRSKTSFKTDIQFVPRCAFYPPLGILGPDTITCFGPAFDAIGPAVEKGQLTLSLNEASTPNCNAHGRTKSADYELGERTTARESTDLVINLPLARHRQES
jgi:hypothetical protein